MLIYLNRWALPFPILLIITSVYRLFNLDRHTSHTLSSFPGSVTMYSWGRGCACTLNIISSFQSSCRNSELTPFCLTSSSSVNSDEGSTVDLPLAWDTIGRLTIALGNRGLVEPWRGGRASVDPEAARFSSYIVGFSSRSSDYQYWISEWVMGTYVFVSVFRELLTFA